MTDGAIQNDADLGGTPARETALACVEAGIEAAHPRTVIRETVALDGDTLRVEGATYDLDEYGEVVLVGGGKAAGSVAHELESLLGDRIDRGVVVTNDPVAVEGIDVVEADHPVPNERGVVGARRVLDLARESGERSLVLVVVTGGGSALLPAPAGDVSLPDLQGVTEELLASGANIHEINAVRKHCSAIKGGRLARTAAPATVVGLAFSDVVGDDPGVIASGPTAPDASTYADALAVLDRYDVDAPDAIEERLERGAAGDLAETPGPREPVFQRVETHVLATNLTALEAAREAAHERGHDALVLSSRIRGEARVAALSHVAIAEEALASGNPVDPPAVILSGGETTVTVEGDGRGGPNQEFALAAALELPEGATLSAVDTDGEDGSTDAAGALVDSETVGEEEEPANEALATNDAYAYLADRDALIHTGKTGTNVNDLRAVVVTPP